MSLVLVPLEIDHLTGLYTARQEQWEHLRTPWVLDRRSLVEWHEDQARDRQMHYLAVVDRVDGHETVLGTGGFLNIDWPNQSAELAMICGDLRHELGAVQELLDYGFNRLNLHRIWVETYTQDRTKLFKEAGFEIEGFKQHGLRRNSKWHNTQVLAILHVESK